MRLNSAHYSDTAHPEQSLDHHSRPAMQNATGALPSAVGVTLSCRKNCSSTFTHSSSLTRTPDTPSANLSPSHSSSSHSQAFSSRFTSENSILLPSNFEDNNAEVSPDVEGSADGQYSEVIDLLKFEEGEWDMGALDYEFQCLNLDEYFKES